MTRRKTEPKVAVLPIAFPPLDRQPCQRCGKRGVTVVALWVVEPDHLPCEALFCSIDCARFEGWPWLDPEKPTQRATA